MNIPFQRLHNQHIAPPRLHTPEDVVGWLGAIQSQDYTAAKWAVGQRTRNSTDDTIERAFNEGTILRTHMMRPTWHFVLPKDIRWILALTAPRVKTSTASRSRQLELDSALYSKSNAVLARALEGGKQLTKPDLIAALQQANIDVSDPGRFTHIMLRAELDAIVCSGPRQGKQFTYALLDERVPTTKPLDRDEAISELTKRYFTSHGPATLKDFVWWSGLTTADARAGINMISSQLMHEDLDGQTYWFTESTQLKHETTPAAYLLPNFDEYVVGYTDRSAIFDHKNPANADRLDQRGNILFTHTIVVDGQIVGIWKRNTKKDEVGVETTLFTTLNDAQTKAVQEAIERYRQFICSNQSSAL